MHRDPVELTEALSRLAAATVTYLESQIDAGVQAVQLFDTWLSEMPRDFFLKHYLPMLNDIFRPLRARKVPVIFYARHAHHVLNDLVALDIDVLSADELLPLSEVERRTQGKFSLQGNLDPLLLFGETGVVRRETRKLVEQARGLSRPAVLNLGHGILPGTPVENVLAFFEEARTLWV
jgi:uroporphyrinogen decarboxylase